jgi:hypothetical protein
VLRAVLLHKSDDGKRTGAKKRPEIPIACLGDVAEPFPAAAHGSGVPAFEANPLEN